MEAHADGAADDKKDIICPIVLRHDDRARRITLTVEATGYRLPRLPIEFSKKLDTTQAVAGNDGGTIYGG